MWLDRIVTPQEFAHNQKITTTTGLSPFILNYRQQPLIRENCWKTIHNPVAEDFVETMRKAHKEAKEALVTFRPGY